MRTSDLLRLAAAWAVVAEHQVTPLVVPVIPGMNRTVTTGRFGSVC
jgi:hypothetical protein